MTPLGWHWPHWPVTVGRCRLNRCSNQCYITTWVGTPLHKCATATRNVNKIPTGKRDHANSAQPSRDEGLISKVVHHNCMMVLYVKYHIKCQTVTSELSLKTIKTLFWSPGTKFLVYTYDVDGRIFDMQHVVGYLQRKQDVKESRMSCFWPLHIHTVDCSHNITWIINMNEIIENAQKLGQP